MTWFSCSRRGKLKSEAKIKELKKLFADYRADDPDLYPLLRLICPELDRQRVLYIKEGILAKVCFVQT